MFAQQNRLSRTAITQLMKQGRRMHGVDVSLVYLPSDTFQCTVIISKKVAKTAVLRNRTKRRLRAALAKSLKIKPITARVAVIAKQNAPTRSSSELFAELDSLLQRLLQHMAR